MSKSALQALSPDWQTWVKENLARACEPHGMVSLMVRDGNIEIGLARAAIEEASNGAISMAPPAAMEMPDIDTTSNVIKTSDRDVDVLLTLQSPRIVLLGNVLSEEECDQLAAYCEPKLQRSPVVNDADGTMQLHQNRTSRGAMIQRGETELVARVERRLAEIGH